ncbi:MAG: hypothetical protein V2A76_10445 [Planctomycetota bacterium]
MSESPLPPEPSRAQRFRHWFRRTFYWWLLLIPAIHLALISYLSHQKVGIFHNEVEPKVLFEVIHPALLVLFTLLSLQGWRLTRQFAFGWMTLFGAVLFCRELHFYGSGPILVGGLLFLLWAAIKKKEERRAFLAQRWAASLFTLSFVSYVVSQLLDRGVFEFIGRVIVWNFRWILLYRSNMEETLEALGGLFLVFTTLTILVSALPRPRPEA